MPSLKKFREMAGLSDDVRRWSDAAKIVKDSQQVSGGTHGWHPQVNQQSAKEFGLTAADFQWSQWPVTNVRLKNSESRYYPFYYLCDISTDVPEPNQYFKVEERDPNKKYKEVKFGKEIWYELIITGIALSWINFELYDAVNHKLITKSTSSPIEGKVTGKPSEQCELWNRLKAAEEPGKYNKLKVYLRAYPSFFYLNDNGGAMLAHANTPNGYFTGKPIESQIYTLYMDHDGNVEVK